MFVYDSILLFQHISLLTIKYLREGCVKANSRDNNYMGVILIISSTYTYVVGILLVFTLVTFSNL